MFCPNCGKQLNDNARFCTECGQQIQQAQQKTAIAPLRSVNNSELSMTEAILAEKRKKRIPVIVPIILVVLIAVFIAVWILTSRKNDSASDNTPMQTDGAASRESMTDHAAENDEISINDNNINIFDYIGQWYTQSIKDTEFSISIENGRYYVSGSAAYQNGNRLIMIEPVPLTISGNIAVAEYEEDSRGNHGIIQLEFQKDVLYATVTAIPGDWSDGWSMAMEDELCTRTMPYFEDEDPDFYYQEEDPDEYDDYWFDRSYIDEDSLPDVSREDIMWARNEIYARHGYIFQQEDIQAAFEAMDWYQPNPNYSDNLLNDIERANLETLIAYERKMGWLN